MNVYLVRPTIKLTIGNLLYSSKRMTVRPISQKSSKVYNIWPSILKFRNVKNTLSTLADRASQPHTRSVTNLVVFVPSKKDSYVYYMDLGTREIYSITLQVCKLSPIFSFYCSKLRCLLLGQVVTEGFSQVPPKISEEF